MTNAKRILFSSILSLTLIQCASPQLTLRERDLIPAKDASERTKVWSSQTISVSQVEDARGKSEFWVGQVGTGARNKPTPVEFERPVSAVVKAQFENELDKRGLKTAPAGDVDLKISVQELEVREVRQGMSPESSVCNAGMTVDVTPKAGGKAKPFKWTGKVEFQNRGTLLDTTSATAATLAGCLNLLVEKMISNAEFKQTMTK